MRDVVTRMMDQARTSAGAVPAAPHPSIAENAPSAGTGMTPRTEAGGVVPGTRVATRLEFDAELEVGLVDSTGAPWPPPANGRGLRASGRGRAGDPGP
ncbi:hypothetical protein QJS66_14065 [Kocuria rhizophila]|nr:hypothetical protein QJS66_14065 [Kocuria rhizophila]